MVHFHSLGVCVFFPCSHGPTLSPYARRCQYKHQTFLGSRWRTLVPEQEKGRKKRRKKWPQRRSNSRIRIRSRRELLLHLLRKTNPRSRPVRSFKYRRRTNNDYAVSCSTPVGPRPLPLQLPLVKPSPELRRPRNSEPFTRSCLAKASRMTRSKALFPLSM